MQQNSERLTKSNVDIIMVAIGDDVDDDECQYVTCGSHPIINIAPEQNPRAVVYSIVGELEEGLLFPSNRCVAVLLVFVVVKSIKLFLSNTLCFHILLALLV